MNRELLDDYLVPGTLDNSKSLKKIYQKYKQLIPVFILTGFCIWTLTELNVHKFSNAEQTSYGALTFKNYVAFIFLTINYLFFFFLRRFYRYILIITLLLGLFNLINFNLGEYSLFIGPAAFIGIQPFIFLVSIFVIYLNLKNIKIFLSEGSLSLEKEKQIIAEEEKEKIELFKEKYQSYSLEDLKLVLSDKRFVYEAKEAAKQLIKTKEF